MKESYKLQSENEIKKFSDEIKSLNNQISDQNSTIKDLNNLNNHNKDAIKEAEKYKLILSGESRLDEQMHKNTE